MFRVISTFFLLCVSLSINAKDLGVHGRVYEIKEDDLLKVILGRAQKELDDGRWNKRVEKWQKQAKYRMAHPKGVQLPRAQQDRSYLYDPTTIMPEDIKDGHGHILYKAGTQVNPLQFITLSKEMVFIDGNDQQQVDWVLNVTKEIPDQYKIILTDGPVIDLMNQYKRRLYFDQNQKYISRLNIKALPAFVYQQQTYLRIDEVKLP